MTTLLVKLITWTKEKVTNGKSVTERIGGEQDGQSQCERMLRT